MKSAALISLAALSFKLASATFHPAADHRLQITTRSFPNATDEDVDDELDPDQFITDVDDEEGWTDLDSHGLMMMRDISDVEVAGMQKRDDGWIPRDQERGLVDLEIDGEGNLRVPRSLDEAKTMAKQLKRRAKTWKTGIITWYTKHDLLNPACLPGGGWNPTDKSMVAAVTEVWSGKPACGSFVQIRSPKSKKAITVRVMDLCAGCAKGTAHFDLTQTAFKKLYALSVGEVHNLQVKVVKSPVKKWTSSVKKLFGPKSLL